MSAGRWMDLLVTAPAAASVVATVLLVLLGEHLSRSNLAPSRRRRALLWLATVPPVIGCAASVYALTSLIGLFAMDYCFGRDALCGLEDLLACGVPAWIGLTGAFAVRPLRP